jgi:hypothetical protein
MASSDRAAAQRRTIEALCRAITEDKQQSTEGIHAPNATAEDLLFNLNLGDFSAYEDFGDKWIESIDDYRFELDEFFPSGGDTAVFTWRWSGILKPGSLGAGRKFSEVRGVSLVTFTEDNLIAKEVAWGDVHGLLRQLELPPISFRPLYELIGTDPGSGYEPSS